MVMSSSSDGVRPAHVGKSNAPTPGNPPSQRQFREGTVIGQLRDAAPHNAVGQCRGLEDIGFMIPTCQRILPSITPAEGLQYIHHRLRFRDGE